MESITKQPDFTNTDIAFSLKSNRSLRRAVFLFSILKYPGFVSLGKWLTRLALKMRLPVRVVLKPMLFDHFCGGETLKGSRGVMEALISSGVGVIPDFSVEGKADEGAFERVKTEVLATISMASHDAAITHAVFKPTGIGPFALWEQLSSNNRERAIETEPYKALFRRLDEIFSFASDQKVPVMVDAEETWIQAGIDQMVRHYSQRYNTRQVIVFNTVQMYRNDRLGFMKEELRLAQTGGYLLGYKIVRGAYHDQEMERASRAGLPMPVFTRKEDTDDAYNGAVKFCFDNRQSIATCLATHNEESTLLMVHLLSQNQKEQEHLPITFAQLYGMSDHITFNLAAAGYAVSKYLPYGPLREVIPYLFRRAEENRSIDGETGRELRNLRTEQLRRKSAGSKPVDH